MRRLPILSIALLGMSQAAFGSLMFSLPNEEVYPPGTDTATCEITGNAPCVQFSGTLTDTDTDGSLLSINGISILFTGSDGSYFTLDENFFFNGVPGILEGDTDDNVASDTYTGPILGVDIATSTPVGVYTETAEISACNLTSDVECDSGGPDLGAFTVDAQFTIVVAPEPAAAGLTLMGLAAMAALPIKAQVSFFRILVLAALGAVSAFGEDPVAALSHRVDQGAAQLPFDPVYGYLPALLEELHVPVESQIAVFSKTSIQALRIEPSNPRVLYFNDSVAVGWVRGGFIELAAQDPGRGIQFYTLQQRPDERLARREICLNCHKSGTTLIRSVTSAPDGIPSGEIDADSRTPFSKLWGGWYVTGSVPAVHMGNAVFANSERREITPSFDPKLSLRPSSDVVALMVFAHQMRMMNLLAHPDDVDELVDYLLFVDEAPLPGPVKGSSGFAEKFSGMGPRDHLGRSLREFDLRQRLMRYPCSYMIYTEAFDALPPAVKEAVYRRIWQILSGGVTGPRYARLTLADRNAVVEILRDTKKGLPDYFRPLRSSARR